MTAAAGHWTARWIGRPWVPGTGDCWSLARAVWAAEFGRVVPPVPVDPSSWRAGARAIAAALPDWLPADPPAEGDGVLMAQGRHPCHIGLWVAPAPGQPGRVLHSIERAGAICTPVDRLGLLGYRVVNCLRHRDWVVP
ncbi:hypothetical protein ruthe_02108 [Rubellimicrobium thermophilum DSM 16684]|uniref:NlpC/P60 domain-containing protein n=1 Tax=Rubellimicrobium thermophilum DSM 16684 TaxID=1123069 RepID=S9QY57_9RHOB|nr:hypothetical protein [Rubellimicrobium thermophilum]EPX84563.1 hypothetical protein ruthe_02108 [Rubellimicrobium thermophilum DSM 16684]